MQRLEVTVNLEDLGMFHFVLNWRMAKDEAGENDRYYSWRSL